MSGFRRSARTQSRQPLYGSQEMAEYHQAVESAHAQSHHEMMMNQGMGMMMGNMGMMNMGMAGNYYNMGNMGYQYPQTHAGYAPQHASYPHQQQQLFNQYQTTPVEASHAYAQPVIDSEPVPGTSRTLRARPAPTEAAAADSPDEDNDEEETGTQHTTHKESGTQESDKSKKPIKSEVTLTVDQMVQNCLYYLFIQQHKKIPIKRSDMIKNGMNAQHKQFAEVMRKLENILEDTFGMNLVRLEKGSDNQPHLTSGPIEGGSQVVEEEEDDDEDRGPSSSKKAKIKPKGPSSNASASYILVSKYPSSVFDSSMFVMTRRDLEADTKKTVLYLILASIFMLNRSIEEESIWKIIEQMEFRQMVCEKRDDLRKFLKSEYVTPAYLNMETYEHQKAPSEMDTVKAKYSWGPRAHKEYSKYSMLKFVTARFPGRQMYDFTVQYKAIEKQEKAALDQELLDGRDTDEDTEDDGDNGSALKIKKAGGQSGTTCLIDGENIDTETEGGE